MKILYFTLFSALLLSNAAKGESPKAAKYQNPVCTTSLPDPTVIEAEDGFFYLYATEDTPHVPIYRSSDLVNWEPVGSVFTPENRPRFVNGTGKVWAPDISRIGNKYVLHYSLSLWGEEQKNGIGAASADSPTGPFTDHGPMMISDQIGVTNSIDQFYYQQGRKNYLFWGSFRGLYVIELADDGLSIKKNAAKIKVAGTAYEAVYIHRKGGFYYMFASIGTCCQGVNSTYTLVVGRSKSVLGPYLDRSGAKMLDNKHEVVMRGNDRFKGPGHNAEFITDATGADWILYHAIDVENPKGRKLLLDRVDWIDGWPVIGNGTPSLSSASPIL